MDEMLKACQLSWQQEFELRRLVRVAISLV